MTCLSSKLENPTDDDNSLTSSSGEMLTERRKFALEAKEIATISANLVESLGDLIDVVTEIAERRKLNS